MHADDDDGDAHASANKETGNKETKESKLAETLKKVLTAGVSAAFMTEESVRSYLAELKLPKELLSTLLQGAAKGKDEIVNRVTGEMISIVRKIDFVREFSRFAEEHKFKITAEVEVVRKHPPTGHHHEDSKDGKESKS